MGVSCGRQSQTSGVGDVPTRQQQQLVRATEGSLFGHARIKRGDIFERYTFERALIGVGGTGSVQCAVDRLSGRRFAVKKLAKVEVSRDRLKMLRNETQLYLRVDHPHICRMIELWESNEAVHVVMEYCSGGDLFDLLCTLKVLPEPKCAAFMAQMLRAVAYLHDQKVVHRDIKVENWLLESKDPRAKLKLIDFGLGRIWQNRQKRMRATCGTLLYVSPENLIGGYTEATDLWSLGVVAYLLLCGYPPFFGTEEDLFARVLAAQFSFQGPRWANVSAEGKDFVRRLLQRDCALRPTAVEALRHPWFQRFRSVAFVPKSAASPAVLHSMRLFASRPRFQRMCLQVMALRLTSEMIGGIADSFLALNSTGQGKLLLTDLADAFRRHEGDGLPEREIEFSFRRLRDKSDSRIGYSTFVAAMLLSRITPTLELLRSCFRNFDSERTGFISFENVRALLGTDEFSLTTLSEMFAEADTDGNGMIDFEEFCALVTNTAVPEPSVRFSAVVESAKTTEINDSYQTSWHSGQESAPVEGQQSNSSSAPPALVARFSDIGLPFSCVSAA